MRRTFTRMEIGDIVSLDITRTSKNPTKKGFGTAMIMAQVPDGWGSTIHKVFGSLDEMVTDGFSTTSRAYQIASKLVAQTPSVETWKVGKRAGKATRVYDVTVGDTITVGDIFTLTVDGETHSHTVVTATPTAVAAALVALFTGTGPANVSASAATGTMTFASTVNGACFDITGWTHAGWTTLVSSMISRP